jgi:hypothetical protein
MRGRHPGAIHGAATWGIATSLGERVMQRPKAGRLPHDARRRPVCRVLAELCRTRGVGAGVANLSIEGL